MSNGAPHGYEVGPWIRCSGCSAPLRQPSGIAAAEPGGLFDVYFSGGHMGCAECGAGFDWWSSVLEMVRTDFGFPHAMQLAGARTFLATTTLGAGEYKTLDLTEYGLPADAEIVHLNLTSNGSARPLISHSNDAMRDPLSPKLFLYGAGLPDQPSDGPLAVAATWFVRRTDDTRERHLVDAARHYLAGRYDGVAVPANIAVEASVTPLVQSAIEGSFGTKKRTEEFLQSAATYGYQLDVLLRMIAFMCEAPLMPADLLGQLNSLRKLRNTIGHEGRCDPLTRDRASELLTAAIFGVRYADLVARYVAKGKANGSLPALGVDDRLIILP